MELPAIQLPQIDLPFNIPVLLHPPVDHFIIALPIIVLLLEIVNLITKKRAIGVTSFFLLLLTVVAAVAAYLTGGIDGKEAYPLLSEAAQSELKEHKLLGTYLMLMSMIVVVFKLLSSIIKRGLMKGLYLLILVLFVAGILKQGKDGGELVYEYGVNVQKVQELDSELDDLKEEIEELEEDKKDAASKNSQPQNTKPVAEVKKESVADVVETTKEKKVEAVKENIKEKTEAAKEIVDEKTENAKEAVTQAGEISKEVTEKVESAVEVVPNNSAQEANIATH